MGEVIKLDSSLSIKENNKELVESTENLTDVAESALSDLSTKSASKTVMSMPIAQLSTLGAGVSSLVPALRKVTQSATVNVDGLYKLANADVGDTLKVAKNGNFWGAFKTANGSSKFAQLQEAGPLTATNTSVAAINPATMMMAVALFSIEQQLGDIAEMERQILSSLRLKKNQR